MGCCSNFAEHCTRIITRNMNRKVLRMPIERPCGGFHPCTRIDRWGELSCRAHGRLGPSIVSCCMHVICSITIFQQLATFSCRRSAMPVVDVYVRTFLSNMCATPHWCGCSHCARPGSCSPRARARARAESCHWRERVFNQGHRSHPCGRFCHFR